MIGFMSHSNANVDSKSLSIYDSSLRSRCCCSCYFADCLFEMRTRFLPTPLLQRYINFSTFFNENLIIYTTMTNVNIFSCSISLYNSTYIAFSFQTARQLVVVKKWLQTSETYHVKLEVNLVELFFGWS